MGLYFIHEFLRASEPRLTVCVCVRVSAGNFFICRPQWLDSKIHPMFEPFDQPNMIDDFQNRARPMNDCLLRVRVDGREAKPAMGKPLQFVGGNFQLCSETISVFCPALRCVSLPPPCHTLKSHHSL